MLGPERRQAVKDLLRAALRCEPSTRAIFIRESAEGDADLSDAALKILQEIESKYLESRDSSSTEEGLLDDAFAAEMETESLLPAGFPAAERAFAGTERFDVRRWLGAGGFGTVYECYDQLQHQLVALKVLRRNDPAFLYRFKREFRALVDIRHENLVELYELFGDGNCWFFTMELVRGVDFLQHVARHGRDRAETGHVACDVERLRAAALGLAEGIMALHRVGMVHRDIKPGNVLVSVDRRVRLLDFGLVREMELSDVQSLMVVGTPAYMAPEQLTHQPSSVSADWYSFGVMLFQALTGTLPRRRQLSPVGQGADYASPIVPADAPADLSELCVELLREAPSSRPSGAEVLARLGSTKRAAARQVIAAREDVLVGREPWLAELTQLVEATSQGRPVIVNLSGTSGIGKSTLLRTLRRRLLRSDPNTVVLMGRCHENEMVPYKALDDMVDGLSHYLNGLPEPEAEALAPRDSQCLIRMFPVLAQVPAMARVRRTTAEIADAQELRQRAFASLQDLLARITDRQTVVVAIDDLQWGDLDSAVVLRSLFSGPRPPNLLFIASYRTEDAATSPFLQNWRAYQTEAKPCAMHDMELPELTPQDSALMAARLLRSVDPATMRVAEAIAREAGGSPFLIEQFVRHPSAQNGEPQQLSIQRVIEDRLNELPERPRRLLETLAVAAQPLPESVAYAAAEFESTERPALLGLVANHLVRFRESVGPRQIEVYHARVGDVILASLSPENRRRRHFSLALAFETAATVDPAAIAIHCREAGDYDRAGRYALAAGNQASNALAFDRAIQFFQLALDCGSWDADEAVAVRRKLAVALANAGRGAQAADVYLTVADAAGADGPELKRLAAEQLLRSGHLNQGLAVLEGVAAELGIWLAPKRWQTALSIVWHRTLSAFYVRRFRDNEPRDIAPHDAIILDMYWSFLIGLALLDPIRAMDFHARHLLRAARAGDRRRFALSLAIDAAGRALTGKAGRPVVDALISRARGLCAAEEHPETLGLIATMEAMCACMAQDWRRGFRLSQDARRFLAERCTGVAWERATASELYSTAAFQLGEWHAMAEQARRPTTDTDDARSRGDVHAMVASIPGGTIPFLTSDQPLLAEAFVRDTISTLPKDRFLMPHLWALNLQVYIAIYQGDGARAWRLVNTEWPVVTRSLFLRLPYVAVVAFDCRARAAIAAAATAGGDAELLKAALRVAQTLSSMHSGWADAIALLIRGGVASVKHEREQASTLLATAEVAFRALEMTQYVAACQHRRGLLAGSESGRRLMAAAEDWATAQAVAVPSKIFDILAPGCWSV